MKHIISYSGGLGSFATAKIVIDKYGPENVQLVFTDTLIEDEDLYRFLDESTKALGAEFIRLADGRTPWEVFKDNRFLGNSRVNICSRVLKQNVFRKWLEENYTPEECIVYIGIDWTEIHRYEKSLEYYKPYQLEAPLCEEENYDISLSDLKEWLANMGIAIPRLYNLGFTHNNCGGFCVKAGQGHFKNLLEKIPERYAEHEVKEEELREYLDKDISIMKDRRNKITRPLTMREFRKRLQDGEQSTLDLTDFGGCGCFLEV